MSAETPSYEVVAGSTDTFRVDGESYVQRPGRGPELIKKGSETTGDLLGDIPPEVQSPQNRGLSCLTTLLKNDPSAYRHFDDKNHAAYGAIRNLLGLSVDAPLGYVVDATKAFQLRSSLAADGNFGPKTLEAFKRDIASGPKLDTTIDYQEPIVSLKKPSETLSPVQLRIDTTISGVQKKVGEVMVPKSFAWEVRQALKNPNPENADGLIARIKTLPPTEKASTLQVISSYIWKTTGVPVGDLKIATSAQFPTQIALVNAQGEYTGIDLANKQIITGHNSTFNPTFG